MSKKMIKQIKSILFIVTGLVLLISYCVVIKGRQPFFIRTNEYKVVLENAGGLFEGSYVMINGMKAGNIYELSMEDNKIIATLGIKKKFEASINQSSLVSLRTKGLLGDRYISIDTPIRTNNESNPMLPHQATIPFTTESSLFSSITNNKKLIKSVDLFLQETTKLLSQLNNTKEGKNILSEIKKISSEAKKFLSEDNKNNIQDILKHTKNILKKIDTGKGTAGALVNDPSLHNKAMSALGKKPYSRLLKILFSGSSSSAID